jgi:GT2 family glycosyltransferase
VPKNDVAKQSFSAPPENLHFLVHPVLISFIVPLHNHLAETRAMLASLQATVPQDLSHEIIFVDDASSDGTPSWLRSLDDPCIRFWINGVNLGYAASNNAGVRLARGDVLALLNNDLVLSPGWIEPMLSLLQSPGRRAGLVGNVQFRVADDGVDHAGVDHAGVALSPRGQLFHQNTIAHMPHVQAFAVTGACMLLRKADFWAVGGFDESFVNGCEDIDLCFKLQQAHQKIYVVSESRIHHHVSLSRKTNTLQDLQNSRLLFSRWRGKIKNELSRVWRELLTEGPDAYADWWPEPIEPEYLSTPHALSRVMAETMLRREEAHWQQMLDGGLHPIAAAP